MKSRDLVFDTPIELTPHQTVAEALSLIPKRSHGAAVVVRDGRPVGIVSEADCAEVDRFAQVGDVMNTGLVTLPPTPTRGRRSTPSTRPGCRWRPPWTPTAGWSGVLTPHRRAARHALRPAVDAAGACGSPPPSASTATSRPRPPSWSRPAWTAWSSTPRTATRTGCSRRCARSGAIDPGVPVAAGNVVSAEGTRALIEAGCRHRQGRRRPGRDVHDPDDDRRRPAAVLRGPRVRARPPASSAGTSGPTGECGTRATSRWRSPPAPRR